MAASSPSSSSFSAGGSVRAVPVPAGLGAKFEVTPDALLACNAERERYDDVLAGSREPGSYFVCRPGAADVVALRKLEKEFVRDHAGLYRTEPWFDHISQSSWYKDVSVIENQALAVNAIRNIILSSFGAHRTLQCVHLPQEADAPHVIVGYVHFKMTTRLQVAHLKVGNSHRSIGISALLLAGMARLVENMGAPIADIYLVVAIRNKAALRLYESLGFVAERRSSNALGPKREAATEWMSMTWRICSVKDLQEFRERCHARFKARAAAVPTLSHRPL